MRPLALIPLALSLLLPACEMQEPMSEPAAPTDVQSAYVGSLVELGRSAVVFANGDIILADSPRLPGDALAGRICALTACDPTGAIADRAVTIPDGGSYAGHERQAGGACVRVNYDCVNGTLVP